jgi:hypothetical protein
MILWSSLLPVITIPEEEPVSVCVYQKLHIYTGTSLYRKRMSRYMCVTEALYILLPLYRNSSSYLRTYRVCTSLYRKRSRYMCVTEAPPLYRKSSSYLCTYRVCTSLYRKRSQYMCVSEAPPLYRKISSYLCTYRVCIYIFIHSHM